MHKNAGAMASTKPGFLRICEEIRGICATIVAVSAVVGTMSVTAWAVYAVPDMQRRIAAAIDPVRQDTKAQFAEVTRALEYIGIQNRVMMTPAQVAKADTLLKQKRLQQGERKALR